MENVEDKKDCCEGKENCKHSSVHSCCHNWKKCHVLKLIILAVVVMIIFCLGTRWGEMRSGYRNYGYERGGMMNWGGFGDRYDGGTRLKGNQVTGEVKIEVTDPATPAQ